MKTIPLLVMAAIVAIGSSLVAQEALPPVEQTIPLEFYNLSYKQIPIHLQKGQELVVSIQNPSNYYHNEEVDGDNFSNNYGKFSDELHSEIDYSYNNQLNVLRCVIQETSLDTNGNPITYHFRATTVSGINWIYFYTWGIGISSVGGIWFNSSYLTVTVE